MKKIEVRKSKIHGRGLIAAEGIKKHEFIGFIKGPTQYQENKTLRDALSHPDWVGFKKNYWTDPLPPFKYINHSCDANCGVAGTRKVFAVKDIKLGEELTIDYSTTEIDENWFLDCTCKSKQCRKKVQSIQSLPQKTFQNYLPYIPSFIRKKYLEIYL